MHRVEREKPNIILITIDALRADHLSCYGYEKETSPTIDALANNGILFLEAISSGGGTPEAFPSIMASIPPPLAINQYKKILKHHTTLAEALSQNGYRAAAFHSNPYLSRFFYYDKGFDTFDDGLHSSEGVFANNQQFQKLLNYFKLLIKGHPPIVRAEELTSRVLAWINRCSQSFFLWIHYMDVHRPYMPPQKYIKIVNGGKISRYKILSLYNRIRRNSDLTEQDFKMLNSLYDASIKYVDDSIRVLLNELNKLNKIDNTILIVTADHGESLGEHGIGHGMVYEEVIKIPLIFSGAGISKNIYNFPVNNMDIAPTIINLVGGRTVQGFQGLPLLPLSGNKKKKKGGIVSVALNSYKNYRMISYRTTEWKYIRTDRLDTPGKIIKEELYNLLKDPKEIKNLRMHKKMQELKTEISKYLTSIEREMIRQKIKELNQKLQKG